MTMIYRKISLTEPQFALLSDEAAKLGVSLAEAVRRILDGNAKEAEERAVARTEAQIVAWLRADADLGNAVSYLPGQPEHKRVIAHRITRGDYKLGKVIDGYA